MISTTFDAKDEQIVTLTYHVTMKDLLALTRYHYTHSRAAIRMRRISALVISIVIFVVQYKIDMDGDATTTFAILDGVIGVAIVLIVYKLTWWPLTKLQARLLYKEGRNKGTIGRHSLSLIGGDLVDTTDVNETRYRLDCIERIVSTDQHTFIYLGALLAHVISKSSVVNGDLDDFTSALKKAYQMAK